MAPTSVLRWSKPLEFSQCLRRIFDEMRRLKRMERHRAVTLKTNLRENEKTPHVSYGPFFQCNCRIGRCSLDIVKVRHARKRHL